MKTPQPIRIPDALSRHLTQSTESSVVATAVYVVEGANLMDANALEALHRLAVPLSTKIASLGESDRLRRRLELLALYFGESASDPGADPATRRDVGFALFYFLKGFDRIPDSIPEVGLVDDALIVDTVIDRRSAALRAHWQRRQRVWPADL